MQSLEEEAEVAEVGEEVSLPVVLLEVPLAEEGEVVETLPVLVLQVLC